jgi:uncharacterized protein (TIGR03382 family)
MGVLVGLALSCASVASPARAWQIQDPLHHNCHERISHAALKAVGYLREPPPLTGDDARLPDNVEFNASPYEKNIYALSLVIGARWPDERGGADFSFTQQAESANDPGDQQSHCLRAASDDGTAGDASAVSACRAAIESLYWQAVASLDDAGNVSPDARTTATFNTAFQGTVDYPLSAAYFFAGRAMHAVEDSFTHTFRTPDGHKIVHVMNWAEQVKCKLDEARDGHGHEKILDDCEDGDPSMPARMENAKIAAADLLGAISQPGSRADREARLSGFFDDWLSYQPGCTLDNRYCQDPVYDWLTHSDKSDIHMCDGLFGCSGAEIPPGSNGAPLLAVALGAALVVLVRRRRRAAAIACGACVLLAPSLARADEEGRGWHAEGRVSLSVDNPAYAFGAAAYYGWARADVGAFAELNPWYSTERHKMNLGATNFGFLAHYIHPLRPDLRLRFGAGLGLSVLNTDLLGVDAGKVGLYANVRLMGLVWQFSPNAALTVDPLDIALPAPELTGWPILWTQHRASAGLQLWF